MSNVKKFDGKLLDRKGGVATALIAIYGFAR